VGYGKTSGAAAAFKAVMDGRQVAVLVPRRFSRSSTSTPFGEAGGVPVKIEGFALPLEADQGRIVQELAEGKVDVIVGTHMLLSKNVQFKNLGLVWLTRSSVSGAAQER